MAINAIFKADSYISVNVGLEKSAGDPFVVGELTGVCVTGSGSATTPVPDGKRLGLGNKSGWASVALEGGFRVPVAAGVAYAVGDVVYITAAGVLNKTLTGNTRFGIVTHEPKSSTAGAGFIIVKIGA
jgi:hypothetical protein